MTDGEYDPFGTLGLLSSALGSMEGVIDTLRPEIEGPRPTPCPLWTVQDLVQHVIGQDLRAFPGSARGEAVNWTAPPDVLGHDWAGEFEVRAALVQQAWDGVDLDAPVPGEPMLMRDRADQQITELVVHTWDLVVAKGFDANDLMSDEMSTALAEHALAWSRDKLRPEYRGPDRAVGPEVPVPADAPAPARLAGWFGRDPAWRAPS